jgi:hypothetical protein
MPYAVVLNGREDVAAVLMLLDDRTEAEAIALDIRAAGHGVEVRQVGEGLLRSWRTRSTAEAQN